jgi:hypothetical protein
MPEKSTLNNNGAGCPPSPSDSAGAAGPVHPVHMESPLATQLPKWDLRPPQALLVRRRKITVLPRA